MQQEHEPGHNVRYDGHLQALPQQEVGNADGKYNSQKEYTKNIILVLKLQDWISSEVTQIRFSSAFDDHRMLLQHQPADVSKKESPVCIVRIRISLRVLVMYTMIPAPVDDIVLNGRRLHDHQKDPEGQLCLVRSVAEETMSASCHSESGEHDHEVHYTSKNT